MKTEKLEILFRELINKIYNSIKIDDDLLNEIEKDLKIISKKLKETQFSRELAVFIESARNQKNQIIRDNYKFLILSNLEKRYKRLIDLEKQ